MQDLKHNEGGGGGGRMIDGDNNNDSDAGDVEKMQEHLH